GRGGSWLWEHLRDDFLPAWHHPLGDGVQDAAIATQGLSRLHNYYVEGLDWLVRQVGIDGIYLDGIGYDRQIMKRVRKVLQRARPDTLVTFHSGNNFDPRYGLNSPAVQYLEHLPYCDSIWFGEGYDYDSTPDYWLVEISGIPFGVAGEMLDHGGNPWRGMLYYGMASRLGWNPQSRPESLWRFWDASQIAATRMVGYWDPRCPVRTGQDEVLATVYLGEGRAIVALASWAGEEVACILEFDWPALGLDPGRVVLHAPAIEGYQVEARFAAADPIPVAPGRGWLLLLT
ncbi:MAG: glycoside hydrolase domain-containing protein, partial [Candidatus Latescibacterota bacterium]